MESYYEGHTGISGDMSTTNDGSTSSTQSYQKRYNYGDNNCSQYDGNRHAPSSSSTSHAPSIPSTRWVPPKGRTTNSGSQSSINAMAGSLYRQTISSGQSSMLNTKYDNRSNGVGEGQRGGGKAKRQHRHNSNDTYNQRNQHRNTSSRPLPKKNIISPESTSFLSSSSTQQQYQSSHDTSCINSKNNDDDIPKLDPNNNTHARRIQQRRRQVLFGKNTAGYEEYIKKIPKHKRPRNRKSLDCPMTPDYLLDIPTKRWQGLMNAW